MKYDEDKMWSGDKAATPIKNLKYKIITTIFK